MKKIFTFILIAATLSFNTASAQRPNVRYNDQDRYQVDRANDNRNYSERQQSGDQGYNHHRDRNNNGNNDYNRQREYDQRNRQYDDRNDGYRKDRRSDRYESNRRVEEAEQNRQQKAKAFGTGVVVGGIAAIVLGVLISGGGR